MGLKAQPCAPLSHVPLDLIQWNSEYIYLRYGYIGVYPVFGSRSAAIAEKQPNPLDKIQSTCQLGARSMDSTVRFPMGLTSTAENKVFDTQLDKRGASSLK